VVGHVLGLWLGRVLLGFGGGSELMSRGPVVTSMKKAHRGTGWAVPGWAIFSTRRGWRPDWIPELVNRVQVDSYQLLAVYQIGKINQEEK